jgi:hypothetical protein
MGLQLQSVEGDAELQKKSGQVLEDLAQALGMESSRELYVQHIYSVLDMVTTGHQGWSSNFPGKLVFQTFMRNANDIVREIFFQSKSQSLSKTYILDTSS